MTKTKDATFLENKLLQFITEDDPLLAILQWVADKLVEVEVAQKVNSLKGKRTGDRTTYRCGTRARRLDTRLGTLCMVIPKLRKGGYIPFLVTEKKRSEQALIEVIQEAWKNGISTRRIDRVAKDLGIQNISASQVNEINKGLDDMVHEFRTRPIESEYPVLWVDALYEKIRNDTRVQNMAVLVVKGINRQGMPQILAVEPMENESEETYRSLFSSLRSRGLKSIRLCVSDAHKGLQAAIRKEFIGASQQRCKVHFMRNILAHVNQKEKERFASHLRQIWLEPDREGAFACAERLSTKYRRRFPQAIECLENGLEDSVQFYGFPEIDHRKISSTNPLERLNVEIRRRSRVVGIFPSIGSYVRVIPSYLIEYEEDWQSGRSYINHEALDRQRVLLKPAA